MNDFKETFHTSYSEKFDLNDLSTTEDEIPKNLFRQDVLETLPRDLFTPTTEKYPEPIDKSYPYGNTDLSTYKNNV